MNGKKISTAPFIALVRLYQLVLSPLIGRQCRFQPTCSHYMIGALQRFGVAKGLYLGTKRLLSCHPLTKFGGKSGFDPVPDVFSWRRPD
jgi:hypothetical protein